MQLSIRQVRAHFTSRVFLWGLVVALLPFLYFAVLAAPRPVGLGLTIANDFPAHRIWYTQMDTYFLAKGYFPLWNPTFEMGAPYLAMCFGTASLYPFRWWTYLSTFLGGHWSYLAQYLQICGHMAFGLIFLFRTLRVHGRMSSEAAAAGSAVFLLNQCFNNFIRFPHGIENIAWVPALLYYALNLTRLASGFSKPVLRAAAPDGVKLALCTALSWLTGYGQFSYVGGLVVGLLALFAARSLSGLVLAAVAGLLGTALSVGCIVPVTEWVSHHPLRNGVSIANIQAEGVTDYAYMFLRPFSVDIHYSCFAFPAFLLLALVGVAAFRSWKCVRLSAGMLIVLLLLGDVSRGVHGTSFPFLFAHLPGFAAFNSPSKLIWLAFLPLAWFIGLGFDAVSSSRRLRWGVGAALAVLSITLALQYSPALCPQGVGIWKPLERDWISAAASAAAYRWLVLGSGAALICYVLVRWAPLKVAALGALCGVFVVFYGQYNTFTSREYSSQALLSTPAAFPAGLLARRVPAGYLGLSGIGVTSANVDPVIYDLMMNDKHGLLGDEHTRFPDSRFLWYPAGDPHDLTLKLTSFGPNHIFFEVESQAAGELIYLTKFSEHWAANYPYEKGVRFNEFYKFAITPGVHSFTMEFLPVRQIVSVLITLLGVFGLASALARLTGHKMTAGVVALLGCALAGAVLLGALTRHSLSARDLFGVGDMSRDPTCTVHARMASPF